MSIVVHFIQVQRIILQHFGRDCCRIFQLLAGKGPLEQKQVNLVQTSNSHVLSTTY